ncbi:hypothetical protein SB761_37360, partial [Pseudomonas sp. SIMBA_064]
GEIYRYLTKPCKSEELIAVVGRATEIALTYNPDEDADQIDSSDNKQTLLVIDVDTLPRQKSISNWPWRQPSNLAFN